MTIGLIHSTEQAHQKYPSISMTNPCRRAAAKDERRWILDVVSVKPTSHDGNAESKATTAKIVGTEVNVRGLTKV